MPRITEKNDIRIIVRIYRPWKFYQTSYQFVTISEFDAIDNYVFVYDLGNNNKIGGLLSYTPLFESGNNDTVSYDDIQQGKKNLNWKIFETIEIWGLWPSEK